MLNHMHAPIVTNVSSTTISYTGTRCIIIISKVISCLSELTDHGWVDQHLIFIAFDDIKMN